MAAEAELLEQKQIIECEAQKLKIREELAKARARVSAYNEAKPINFEEAIIHKVKQIDHDDRYHRPDYGNTIPWKEKNSFNTWDSSALEGHCKEELRQKPNIKKNVPAVAVDEGVSKIMCKLLKKQSAPDFDIDVFSGNPMDFHYFMAAFNEIVEKKVNDPRGKLIQLIKYTTGDAKEMAKNCIQLPAEIVFETAKRLFIVRYGDPYRIITAYRKEIKYWLQIKAGDADAYQKFQDFLVKLENIGHLGMCWIHLTLCACKYQSY